MAVEVVKVASMKTRWADLAVETLLNVLNSPDEMKNRRGNFFFSSGRYRKCWQEVSGVCR